MADIKPKVHKCPADGVGVTECCNKTVFSLPRQDRITLDPSKVTCNKILALQIGDLIQINGKLFSVSKFSEDETGGVLFLENYKEKRNV